MNWKMFIPVWGIEYAEKVELTQLPVVIISIYQAIWLLIPILIVFSILVLE